MDDEDIRWLRDIDRLQGDHRERLARLEAGSEGLGQQMRQVLPVVRLVADAQHSADSAQRAAGEAMTKAEEVEDEVQGLRRAIEDGKRDDAATARDARRFRLTTIGSNIMLGLVLCGLIVSILTLFLSH